MYIARITGMDKQLRAEIQKRITAFFWHPRKMCLISMAVLQNKIQDGGIGLPNLTAMNKALLVTRIAK